MKNLALIKFSVLSMMMGFVLAGCSGGTSAGEDARAQQTKDAATLQTLYSGVTGIWDGTVTNTGTGMTPFAGQLKLYMNFVADGTNPDGSPKLRPVLRGRFQPNDFIAETDLFTLTGDYDRSGRIILTGSFGGAAGGTSSAGGSATGTADTRIFSLIGTVTSAGMSLQLTRQGGVWGYFQGTRTATDASAPVGGEALEYRERFLRIYGPLEGRYIGTMKSVNGNDYKVQVSLVIVEGGGGTIPSLGAQYDRLDAPPGTLTWNLNVSYDSQTTEIFMRESSSAGSTVPGGMILSLSGTLNTSGGKRVLNVQVRNKTAVIGQLQATRN